MNTRMRIALAAFAGAGLIAAGGSAAAFATTGAATAATRVAATHGSHRAARPDSSAITWHPLHLLNGWKALSDQTYGAPSYAVQDGVLYLSGILQAPEQSPSPEFAVLPAGDRPTHFLWVVYYNFGGAGTNLVGNMEIQPNGDMFAYANTGPLLNPSLQAISFPLSS
jgi:hypothetical protein